jgi:hypothetical protein
MLRSGEYGWSDGENPQPDAMVDPAGLTTGSTETIVTNVAEPVWDAWRKRLVELGGTNPLLHFPDHAAIELSTGHPGGLARFFSGTPTFLRNLVRDDVALHRARNTAIRINDKNVELAAARGINSVYLAVGTVEWTNGSESFKAPMLVRPISMHRRGDDIELQLTGSLRLNRALARELAYQFGVALDEQTFVALTNDNGSFRPNGALDRLRGLIAHIEGATVSPTLAVANLSDVASEMLSAARVLDHPLLDALGGNANATKILTESHAAVDPGDSDTRSLETDALMLDADTEQERIIAHIVAGNSIVVGTPSGAGATQTVVNALGELMRAGKSVLVVGPRRARLDSVRRRLRGIGLDGVGVSPSSLTFDLIRSISRIEKTPVPNTADVDSALLRMRTILREYRTALAQPDARFGVSVLDALRELARLANDADATNEVTLDTASVIALTNSMPETIDALLAIAQLGQFDAESGSSPWLTAHFATADQASLAYQAARRLDSTVLTALDTIATEVLGPTPLGAGLTFADVNVRLELFQGLADTLDKFTPELFDRSIGDLVEAYGPKNPENRTPAVTRRRLKKLAKECLRPGAHVPDMFDALSRAAEQRTLWNQLVAAAYRPSVPAGLAQLAEALASVGDDIDTLSHVFDRRLDTAPRADLISFVRGLASDSASIETIHERSERGESIRARGLEPLLESFAGRIVTREIIKSELTLAWWRGVLEAIIAERRQLLGADTNVLDRLENDYRLVDQAHVTGNSHKLAHTLAESWRIALRDFPDQAQALKVALKAGNATAAHLRDVAPSLLDIVAPVWVVSPYAVSQLAPDHRFDVVVLVDGAALSEAEAAPAIARGGQIVAFGDPIADQPTPFVITPTDTPPTASTVPSVLAKLAQHVPTHTLTRSYRPLGTALAAQISAHLYSNSLSSWPLAEASLGQSGLTFIGVDGSAPLDERTGRIEAAQVELDAVVANVIEHATLHPEESLMVVSASTVTVDRIHDSIQSVLPANRTLQDFFARHEDEPFVVITLQQASAVTRDRVIFSLGFGRSPHGRVLSDLGALSTEDGKRLVAVAVTRANHHLTVISSLTTAELREERMSAGAQSLGEFIDDTLSYVPPVRASHPLLDDLGRRLEQRGAVLIADVPGIPLAARVGDVCIAIDIDDNLLTLNLREGLRIRPAMLERCGWKYARVHELQLFLSPDIVADRIVKAIGGGQATA